MKANSNKTEAAPIATSEAAKVPQLFRLTCEHTLRRVAYKAGAKASLNGPYHYMYGTGSAWLDFAPKGAKYIGENSDASALITDEAGLAALKAHAAAKGLTLPTIEGLSS